VVLQQVVQPGIHQLGAVGALVRRDQSVENGAASETTAAAPKARRVSKVDIVLLPAVMLCVSTSSSEVARRVLVAQHAYIRMPFVHCSGSNRHDANES
jgi:hypothetical protein